VRFEPMTFGLVVQCSNKYATEPCENIWQFFIIYEKIQGENSLAWNVYAKNFTPLAWNFTPFHASGVKFHANFCVQKLIFWFLTYYYFCIITRQWRPTPVVEIHENWRKYWKMMKIVRNCLKIVDMIKNNGKWWKLVEIDEKWWKIMEMVKNGENCWKMVENSEK